MSALGSTYQREGFNDILDLIPKAEKIKQLHAICKLCYHQASFTLRTVLDDANVELIGGGEAYMPVCRECYLWKTQEQQAKARTVATEVSEVVYDNVGAGDDERKAANEDDTIKLIVSVQKSAGNSSGHKTQASAQGAGSASQESPESGEAREQASPAISDGVMAYEPNESPETLKQ